MPPLTLARQKGTSQFPFPVFLFKFEEISAIYITHFGRRKTLKGLDEQNTDICGKISQTGQI